MYMVEILLEITQQDQDAAVHFPLVVDKLKPFPLIPAAKAVILP